MKKILYTLILILIMACQENKKPEEDIAAITEQSAITGIQIADTIIYDVIIRNPNPDDSWTESCLAGFKRTMFIDSIFTLVYSGRLAAYDFESHKELRVKDIKQIEAEKDFARDKIGKIQFKEKWFFDTRKLTFTKEIISMIPGYEVYDDAGELRGYKPVFLIILK